MGHEKSFLTSDVFVRNGRDFRSKKMWQSDHFHGPIGQWLDSYARPVLRLIPARMVVINKASNPR